MRPTAASPLLLVHRLRRFSASPDEIGTPDSNPDNLVMLSNLCRFSVLPDGVGTPTPTPTI